jgi:hypothetical protein
MRFSERFGLGTTQPYLDFVDIRLDTDIPVFVDPSALKRLQSPWGNECASLVQSYFETVLNRIKAGDHEGARLLLSCLNERNEFHFGYSAGRSRGHAFGTKSASSVWGALSKSKASVSGLLKDLEDTCLLIEGIGPDMISDAVCNILRGPLIRYTQDMCRYYGVALTPDVDSGPVWNPEKEIWESSLVPLPVADHEKIILVPKLFVRQEITYRADRYYRFYLLPAMQQDELRRGSGLVQFLKNRQPRVTKKSLYNEYGSDKLAIAKQTLRFPHILERYRDAMGKQVAPPMGHMQLAGVGSTASPDWTALAHGLRAIPAGRDHATAYEDHIERILSAVFYPSLCRPTKQHKIHEGRKRIDLTYSNEATGGFFYWLATHYPAALIFVECKNYGKEVGNPELDQLGGRFSPSRGKFGMLVCRTLSDANRTLKGCIDTAKDARGYIIVLTDDDILELLDSAMRRGDAQQTYMSLMQKFRALID